MQYDVLQMCFSLCGKRLVTKEQTLGDQSYKISVYDVTTGNRIYRRDVHPATWLSQYHNFSEDLRFLVLDAFSRSFCIVDLHKSSNSPTLNADCIQLVGFRCVDEKLCFQYIDCNQVLKCAAFDNVSEEWLAN